MTQVTVKIEDWELLDMLMERYDIFGDIDNKDLFEQMYQNAINNGFFEGIELNISDIVDNDVVNYCTVLYKAYLNTEDWEKLLKLYEGGEYDVSCEKFEYGKINYIEAVSKNKDRILIRY